MNQFSELTSPGLKLENKTYTLKRSIIFSQGMDLMKSYLRWTSKFHNQASDCNNNNYSSNLKSDLDVDDLFVTAVSTKAMTVNIGITQADSLCNNVNELLNRNKILRNNVFASTCMMLYK